MTWVFVVVIVGLYVYWATIIDLAKLTFIVVRTILYRSMNNFLGNG